MTTPNPQTPPLPKPKKSLLRRLLKWTLRAAILLITLAITAYAIVYYWSSKTINTEIARIRAAGEPLTFADLDKLTPKVDRAQDAAPYYLAAFELVDVDYQEDIPHYNLFFGKDAPLVPIPPEAFEWAHKNIDHNLIALDLLDRGSVLTGYNSDIHLEYGMFVALSRVSRPRALLDAASLRARTLALENHGDQALDSVVSTCGLLRTMERQPVLLAALVQTSLLGRICKDTAFVLNYGHPSDASLQKLSEAMFRLHIIPPRQMFIAERVYYLEIMRNLIATGSVSSPNYPDETPPLPERGQWDHLGISGRVLIAKTLPTFEHYVTASNGDWPAVLAAFQTLADKPTTIWDQMAPSFGSSLVSYVRTLSIYRSTLIALQIERYRRAHNNQLPDSLSQLPDPANLPKDPFTGTSLLYIKTEGGYCVMSAGRNNPKDNPKNIDPTKDPITWSTQWGTHIRTTTPPNPPPPRGGD